MSKQIHRFNWGRQKMNNLYLQQKMPPKKPFFYGTIHHHLTYCSIRPINQPLWLIVTLHNFYSQAQYSVSPWLLPWLTSTCFVSHFARWVASYVTLCSWVMQTSHCESLCCMSHVLSESFARWVMCKARPSLGESCHCLAGLQCELHTMWVTC